MDLYLLGLRVVHILGGAFWLGAATVFVLFMEPAATELGRPGQAFMANVAGKRRLPVVIAVASLLNIVAGMLLYWRSSGGLNGTWIRSGPGLGFTVGAIAAVASWLIGFLISRPTIDKLAALASRPDQGTTSSIAGLQRHLRLAGRGGLALVVVAATAMSVARYL